MLTSSRRNWKPLDVMRILRSEAVLREGRRAGQCWTGGRRGGGARTHVDNMRPLLASRPRTLSPGFLAPDSDPTMKCWIVCAREGQVSLTSAMRAERAGETHLPLRLGVRVEVLHRDLVVLHSRCCAERALLAAAEDEVGQRPVRTRRTGVDAPASERKLEALPKALAHVEHGVVAQGA